MSSDSIHDAVLCAERRARTPARSIDAAIVKEPSYGRDCRLANGIYRRRIHIVREFPDIRLIEEMSFCAGLRAFGKRHSARTKTIRSNAFFCVQWRRFASKIAPSVENCRQCGALSPCDHSKARPLIASV